MAKKNTNAYELNPNELVRFLKKPTSEFTKNDIFCIKIHGEGDKALIPPKRRIRLLIHSFETAEPKEILIENFNGEAVECEMGDVRWEM